MGGMISGEVSGQERAPGAGGPNWRHAGVRVLATWGLVERIIEVADSGSQRQIPLERRLERARGYILKDCERQDISLWKLRVCASAICRAISRSKREEVNGVKGVPLHPCVVIQE